jgi:hypothetical protein
MSEVAAPVSASNAVSNVGAVANAINPAPEVKTDEPKVEGKKRVLKVNGQDYELDDAAFERYASKGIGSEKKLWEANKLQKEAMAKSAEVAAEKLRLEELKKQFEGDEDSLIDSLIKKAQNDPQKLNKVRQKVEQWLIDQIKMEQATPEQQELERYKRQAAQREKELEDFKKQESDTRMKAETQKYREIFTEQIKQGLDLSGLPATEWNVKHMADLQMQALKAGLDLQPQQLAEMLRQDRIEHVKSITSEISKNILDAYKSKDKQKILMAGEQLERLAPPEFLNALRVYDLEKISSGQPSMPKKAIEVPVPKTDEEEKRGAYKMSWSEAETERKRVVAELERQFRSR